MTRYNLECAHDGDNDFIKEEDPQGTWMKAADVERVLRDRIELHKKRRQQIVARDGHQELIDVQDHFITEDTWLLTHLHGEGA